MPKRLKKILEKIMLGKIKDLKNIKFTISEYLTKDDNGITFLEHLLKNKIKINILDECQFGKYLEITYLYCKYGYSVCLFEYSEEILFKEFNGKRIIEYLVENNQLWNNSINVVKNHIEIIDILKKENTYNLIYLNEDLLNNLVVCDEHGNYPLQKYLDEKGVIEKLIPLINNAKGLIEFCIKNNVYNLLKYVNEKVLMYELEKGYTLLDNLLDKNIYPEKITNIPDNLEFVNYLRKRNLYNYLVEADENVLLLKINKKNTLLEELIKKEKITKITTKIYKEETIKILYKYGRLDLLCNVNKDLLNKSVRDILNNKKIPNLLLIDILLKNNCDLNFEFSGFDLVTIAKKLYENNRFDLLAKAKILTLLNSVNETETYFDYLLENIKNKSVKYDLNDFIVSHYRTKIQAKFYLIIAKHDMMEYIDDLTEEELLNNEDDKTLLEQLLILDKQLTIDKVLTKSMKSKMPISIILKSYGIEQEDIDIPLIQSKFTDNYLTNDQQKRGIGPLQIEGTYLLKKLEALFNNDSKSDKLLVSILISGYRQALFNNYELYIQELRNLVEIKETNKNKFFLKKSDKKTCFNIADGSIYADRSSVETILHETGHALHYYLTNFEVPENYETVVEKVRLNKKTLEKVEQFSKEYNEIQDKIETIILEKYKNFFDLDFNDETTKEIILFLEKSLIDKKEEFKFLGISEETLDTILNSSFTVYEYRQTQKRMFIKQYLDTMMRSEFGGFMAIADILDAIYEGELHSNLLKNENGDIIKGTSGHGISYYYSESKRFKEIISDFSTIAKLSNSSEVLSRLKDIIGEELYNVLSDFYYNEIVISKNNKTQEFKIL